MSEAYTRRFVTARVKRKVALARKLYDAPKLAVVISYDLKSKNDAAHAWSDGKRCGIRFNLGCSRERLMEIVPHEVAHLVTYEHEPPTRRRHHDALFKSICRALGGDE